MTASPPTKLLYVRGPQRISLDYKRADSLGRTDGKKIEVTKDVSSFVNSSGSGLIYGIAEFSDDTKRHLPERFHPIRRSEFSKEWLEQVIRTIQPRIERVVIHPVVILEADKSVCYVVEVRSRTSRIWRATTGTTSGITSISASAPRASNNPIALFGGTNSRFHHIRKNSESVQEALQYIWRQ